jgi:methyl-accepting chemotaxis protein
MFRNTSIKTRLVFVLALLSLELIAGACVGLFSLGRANGDMTSMYEDRVVALGQLDQVVQAFSRIQLTVARAATADAGAMPALAGDIEADLRTAYAQWKAYMATYLTPEEALLAKTSVTARDDFLRDGLAPAQAALRVHDAAALARMVHGATAATFAPVRSSIDALIKLQLKEAARLAAASHAAYSWVKIACLSGLAIGLALAAFIGAMLVRGIVNPLGEAVRIAHGVAGGDLTQRIEVRSNDETGRVMAALKDMNAALARIVGQVRGGTDSIASAAGQIAAGNQDLSARTEQQAGAIEETAASLEQLTATVKANAENAAQARLLAVSASDVASQGGAVVAEVVRTMGAINASANKIVDIIAVIDGIAFQTNILALNAAVEAARAGEQGRGFAVVASEVRSLAQRSAAAAREVKGLIEHSVENVQAGTALVDKAGATMGQIVTSVGRVTDIMTDIATASREQTAGIEQVCAAITQMDRSTQQNAALVEEAAAAAQQLREQADALAQAVGTFRIETRPLLA